MAKAYPSDDEDENIGLIGNCLSADTSHEQGSSKYFYRSIKARVDAITYGDVPPSQMDGRKKENKTFGRSHGSSEGDKEQIKYDVMHCTKTDYVVSEKDTISQSKTSTSQSQSIKKSHSDSSQRCYISREESLQKSKRVGKDSLKGNESLGKWQTNKTQYGERQKRISIEGKGNLQGDSPFGIRRKQIKDSTGSLHFDIKTEKKSNPKKNYSDVRKQCNMSVESVRKMKNTNGSDICDVSGRSKKTGHIDVKHNQQKHTSMGRTLNMKTKHGHDTQQCDLANGKWQEMKTGDDSFTGEGQKLVKNDYGDCGLHSAISSEIVKTLVLKNDDDYGSNGDISSWTKDGDRGIQCEISCGTVHNKTTTDGDCRIQCDSSSGTRQEIKTADCAVTNTCDFSNGRRQEMNTNYVNSGDILTREKHKSADCNSTDTDQQCKTKVMQKTELSGRQMINLRKLIKLSIFKGDPDKLLSEITDRTQGFEDILDCEIKPNWLYHILKILANVCTSSNKRNLIEILLKVEETFLPRLNTVFCEISIKNKLYSCIWEDATSLYKTCLLILKILQVLVQTIESSVRKCKRLLLLVKEIRSVFLLNDEALSREIQNSDEIMSAIVIEIDHNCSRTFTMSPPSTECAIATVPPEDFRELSIWPSIDDIQTNANPFLREIRSKGTYENLDLYLDIHFRLLREDFMNPLRKGISEYIQTLVQLAQSWQKRTQPTKPNQIIQTRTRKIREIKVYNNVEIVCPTFANEGINHLIKFDVSDLKRVDWSACRRFIYGSLVCLSCDNFRTIYNATVHNRNVKDLHNGLVEVRFEKVPLTNRSTRFLMAESTTYFEAFRHVLTGLQTVDSSLPFQRYILDCNPTIKPPSYLLCIGVPVYDFTCILPDKPQKKTFRNIPALNEARWPTPEDLSLDRSQNEALRLALTKELAIIQGPPGTGKTYIGLQITKMLLDNKSYWKDSITGAPILVVCYTNHALDQFLEGISRFCKGRIARIGGRCKNPALEQYTLSKLKTIHRSNKSKSQRRDYYNKTNPVRTVQINCEKKVKRVTSELKKTFTEIQPYIILNEHMTYLQRKAFEINKSDKNLLIIEWLKIVPSPLMQNKHLSENEGAKLLWMAHISKDVDKMSKTDKNLVSDVYEIDLLRRAQLYKYWLAEYQTDVSIKKDSHTELEANLDSLRRKSQPMIIYPVDMMPYIRSQHTKFQLKCVYEEVYFEDWLALDGTSSSKDAIYHIYNEVIHDSENEVEATDQPRLESNVDELFGNVGDFEETTRDWILNWNARYEHENLTVVATGTRELSIEKATRMVNMWFLPDRDRRSLYWHWVCKHRDVLKSVIEKTEQKYRETAGVLTEIRDEETIEILCKKDVIGMTTTGAAKNRQLLQSIKPAILIVEEAAEVLESHIVTALNENCKHLILIGDHKQLRPSTTVYHLAQKYHMDISLFERMVLNDIPCVTLSEQHRMRPEISILLKNEYLYPELRDHTAVSEYENISGVDSDVFFIEHSEMEAHIPDSTSYQNPHEAKFTVRLCKYLLKQGYEESRVTILTPYMGQVTLLRKEMRNFKMNDVHVTAVDNFQGEENDIIILSLVRSNTKLNRKNQIGFLAIANRVCVALSRAKKGFYVIGNFALMKEYSLLWKHNVTLMANTNRIGQEITLRCQNHPKTIIKASKHEDFDNAPEGGCTEPCLATLKCNHVCPKICHIIDRDHANAKCMEACALYLPECGHRCKKKCFEECAPCRTQVEKEASFCGHRVKMPCPLDPDDWKCKRKCEFQLQCGHLCGRMCDCCKRENEHEHLCKARVAKELACGHTQKLHCYQDPDTAHCKELCCVSLPCGHEADIACGFKTKVLHEYKCKKRVSKQLQCGHILELQCFKDLSAVACTEPISVTLLCGHVTEIQCSQNPSDAICSIACGAKLSCSHICTGTCGTCFGGKIHKPCVKQCQKNRPCGHNCRHRCGEPCPPCHSPCEWICSHGTKCRNKCSEQCDPCRRKCNYRCIHSRCTKLCYEICDSTRCNKHCTQKLKCGHNCAGLCGELCVCSKSSCIKNKRFYDRSDRGAVYIKLPKCGCIIPQNVLDEYMSKPSYARDEILKRCMVCRKVISSRIQRYSNTIKQMWNAVCYESRAMEISEKVSNTHKYKHILFRRVHRLIDIGLEESNVNILKDRLRDTTFDARYVIEKTVDLLEQILMVSQNLPAELETDLVIKPIELNKLILKERKYYTAQLWGEIRNEIKRIDDYLRLKNLHQEAIEECLDYDTASLSDNED